MAARRKAVKAVAGRKRRRAPAKTAAPPFELPTELSEISTSLAEYILFIYGREKVGKTTLVAEFEDCLILATEPGHKSVRAFVRPCLTWDELKRARDLVLASDRFQNVAVDTASNAYEMCMEAVCKKRGIDHPSDEGFGKGWKAVEREFHQFIRSLALDQSRGLILLAHGSTRPEQKKQGRRMVETGRTITGPLLPGTAKKVIEPMADVIGYYDYDVATDARVLRLAGSATLTAGCRLKQNFLDSDGRPLQEIPMGSSSEEAHANLFAAFNNELTVAEPTRKRVRRRRKAS